MLLNIAATNLIRNVRPFETVARSTWSRLFADVGRHPCNITRAAFRPSSSLISDTKIRPLTKVPDNAILTTQQRSASAHGDHVRLWVIERAVAVALPVLLPAAFVLETPITDGLLALLVVMHSHWGLEAIIMDYARPLVVGNILPKILFALLYAISAATLAGLLMLIYSGPGIARACKDFWAIGNSDTKKA